MNQITSEQVAEWMQQQLAKAHELSDYAHVTVEINQYKVTPTAAKFRIFCGKGFETRDHQTIEDCFEQLAAITPKSQADQLREQAARLLAAADEIEAKASNRIQP